MIDFKEIPSPQGNADGDRFELFARDFLKELGFEIVGEPARGKDFGIDIKVKDLRSGSSKHQIPVYILVSCKHFAQTNDSVVPSKEKNVFERLKQHGCGEFIGFYSTIASTGLIKNLEQLTEEQNIKFEIFDPATIETKLLGMKNGMDIFHRYFRTSYTKWISEQPKQTEKHRLHDQLVDAVLTGNIICDIIKLKAQILDAAWPEREHLLNELNNFTEYQNVRISREIIFFLSRITGMTRSGLSTDIAASIDLLILNYFPYSEDPEDLPYVKEIANECIHIASQLAYDAIFHLDNLSIVEWALSILKFLFQQTRGPHAPLTEKNILDAYKELEDHMNSPGRGELSEAKLLVSIFKADLRTEGLTNPVLPGDLFTRVLADEFSYRDMI